MGMPIKESLEWLISRKEHYEMDDNCQELAQALDVAVDTMNKYQKIKEYISIPNRYGTMAEDCQKLEYVRKVVEDGKID